MSQTGIAYMKLQMETYFSKVKAAITAGAAGYSLYSTGTIPANGSVTYDAPTELGFTSATHYPFTVGIQLSINDPAVSTNPPVIGPEGVISYEIEPDGKIVLRNSQGSPVTYYAKYTLPVKR